MNLLCLLGHEWQPIGPPYESVSTGATFGPYRCSVCDEERLRTRGIGLSATAAGALTVVGMVVAFGGLALVMYHATN